MPDHAKKVSLELGLRLAQVAATAELLDGGATVPFIARYRKERTGSLDEVAITAIRDRLKQLCALEDRRDVIVSSLADRELLTPELHAKVADAQTLTELEDIYLPYRPKRRTRAIIAREKGLEPLAQAIFAQDPAFDPQTAAESYVDPEKGVLTVDDALAGARDVLAEKINESMESRAEIRKLFAGHSTLRSTVIEENKGDAARFSDYFDWSEPIAKMPAHRIHAILRAEREGAVRVSIRPEEDPAIARLQRRFVRGKSAAAEQVLTAAVDGYRRLMAPSIENEIRSSLKERADQEAIRVFATNLRELLMAAPLGPRRVLAIDPGYRTGGKLVCLDEQGTLLAHTVIYPTGSDQGRRTAGQTILDLVRLHRIEAIAIGNGTASRETETLVRGLSLPAGIPILLVNESGASIYSASELARQELPDVDITVRGAVSIGRRLMDPLAELVKIDPKSIGVGQYQHDVDASALQQALNDVIESCVNSVGVDVNTASPALLSRVAGLNAKLAANIVAFREQRGPFLERRQLLEVPRVGPKAFEQAAGFLRIRDGRESLDGSAVHPERYDTVRKMAADLGCAVADLMRDAALRGRIDLTRYASNDVGLPTLEDILAELAKPGRDPRKTFETFSFSDDVREIEDLRPGMKLPGIVTNVTAFGAFVDIGVHQDGLVHVSELADRFVTHPSSVVHLGQQVHVTVIDVDPARKRIGLSLRKDAQSRNRKKHTSGAK
ncbi:RNA-binding transcriptional accessory protein [Candidatus Bipolaricaulota bacterium]|nr:RNA-binding transcriptional accessory protein [Candidatus Bipolaricaulota bacterium]